MDNPQLAGSFGLLDQILENGLLKGWHHIINETPTYGHSDLLKISNTENQLVGNSVSIEKKEGIKEVVNKRSRLEKNTTVPGILFPGNAENLKDKSYQELYEMGIVIDPTEYLKLK